MSTQSFASRLSSPETRLTSVFPRRFGRNASWPNPEQSVGELITQVGKDSIWEAQGEAREAFKGIAPDIKTHLDQCIEPLTSWVTWSIYMMGRSPSSSSPTIIFCSEVAEHRRKIRDVVKNSGILDRYTGIKTGHMPRLPDFDQLVPLVAWLQPRQGRPRRRQRPGRSATRPERVSPTIAYADPESARDTDATDVVTSIGFELSPLLYFGITPVLPLTIRRTLEGDSNFSKATIGGVICIGEKRFYTTAAHAIVPGTPSPGEAAHHGDASYQSEDDAFSFDGSEESASTTDVSSSEAPEKSPEEQECGENRPHEGSQVQGLPSPAASNMCQNPPRPADFQFEYQRDVFFTQLEDGPGAALDYALIPLAEDDARNVNMVYHGHVGVQEPLMINGVVKPPPQDVAVVLITCHGNLVGRMAATPVYSLAPGSNRVQKMLSATFEGRLKKGDCGSWVIDSHSGDLYGHLVAGSPTSGKALLISFFEIFGDIQNRTGLMPHLPVAQLSEPTLEPSGATNSTEVVPWRFESPAEDSTDTVSAKGKEVQRDATESAVASALGRLPCAGSIEGQIIKNWARSMTAQFKIIMRAKHVNEAKYLRSRSNREEEPSQVHSPSNASIQALRDHMSHHSQAVERQGQYGNLNDSSGSDKQEIVSGSGSGRGTAVHSPDITIRTTNSSNQHTFMLEDLMNCISDVHRNIFREALRANDAADRNGSCANESHQGAIQAGPSHSYVEEPAAQDSAERNGNLFDGKSSFDPPREEGNQGQPSSPAGSLLDKADDVQDARTPETNDNTTSSGATNRSASRTRFLPEARPWETQSRE